MQGGTDGADSKWTKGVSVLLSQAKADVVCLQESGTPSGNIQKLDDLKWIGNPPNSIVYSYFLWTPIKQSYYVLWVNTDSGSYQGRVNLAIVSPTAPEFFLYGDPGLKDSRPSIGFVLNGGNTFTIHAYAKGGGDSDGLIKNVEALGLKSWNVAGDYNREPNTWTPSYGVLCPPDKPTRPESKKKLDYMVKSYGDAVTGTVIDSFIVSDHYPVVFDV